MALDHLRAGVGVLGASPARRVDDVLAADGRLDFTKAFLPESLVRSRELTFFGPLEQRALDHVRAHAYLGLSVMAEDLLLPFVLDHVRPRLRGDVDRTGAFLQLAFEESQRRQLLERFRGAFVQGFGSRCEVVDCSEEIVRAVLSHHPLAVGWTALQFMHMRQRHHAESLAEAAPMEPHFRALLAWRADDGGGLVELIVETIARACRPHEIDAALEDYLGIVHILDDGLTAQIELDRESLTRVTGRGLTEAERARFFRQQRGANRLAYLAAGMTHPRFFAALARVSPGHRARVAALAASLS